MERRLLDLRTLADHEDRPRGSASVVLVEDPFGRARPGIDRLVDLALHLQVPLHVGLARRLLRDLVPPAGRLEEPATADLRRYLQRYLAEGAELYRVVEAAASGTADLVLDGLRPREVLADDAVVAINGGWAAHLREPPTGEPRGWTAAREAAPPTGTGPAPA